MEEPLDAAEASGMSLFSIGAAIAFVVVWHQALINIYAVREARWPSHLFRIA
jgi:hypothetical protein